jgi:O-antigen ligase
MYPTHGTGPFWLQVRFWALQLPLIYFAVGTRFSFKNTLDNTALGAEQGSMLASGSSSTAAVLEQIAIVGVLMCFLLPNYKLILQVLARQKLIASLAVLPMISVLWSNEPRSSIKEGFFLFLSTGFAIYFAKCLSPESQMRSLWVTSWICVLSSIVISLALPQYGIDYRTGRGDEWQGLYGGKNNCAISIFFLLMPALYLETKTQAGRFTKWALLLLMLFLIGMTRSKTALFLVPSYLLFAALLWIVRKFKSKERLLLLAFSGSICVSAASMLVLNAGTLLGLVGRDLTFTGRTTIWAAELASIMKRPLLGYGYHAFWTGATGESANIAIAVNRVFGYAHNGYLGVWLEVGILGLMAVCAMVLYGIYKGVRLWSREPQSHVDWYLGALIFTIFYNVDEGTLLFVFNITWMLVIVSYIRLTDRRSRPHTQSLTSAIELMQFESAG